ncbi:hypothetical protein HMF8227_00557 [Saliniradius amylolyticus]|uniref:Transglutaminase-like domain-containing protein n=2 Tax=Saliniradius amylolyticus TaxID=2183582 RepID=A0A2S2E0B0_9ALTE|nr:hypothetical protein HMF8227_00557 [Saliniradius amylolyticus]
MRRYLVLLLFLSLPIEAQQLLFEKTRTQAGYEFEYRWRDADKRQLSLAFTLPHDKFPTELLQPKAYHPKAAQRRIYMALMKHSSELDPRLASVRIQRRGRDLSWSIRTTKASAKQDIQRQLMEVRQSTMDQYLWENYYHRFESFLGQEGIKPDHMRFANESQPPLLPVSQALYQSLNTKERRPYIRLLLGWLQSIPYNPLDNRLESNGSGYLSPPAVILNNVGDCDSKTTLAGSLLATMLPKMSTVIIYLPNHALLGLKIAPLAGEKTLKLDGETYVLAEPTGPALLPIGEIGPDSERAIDTGMYHFERF